MSHTPLGLFGLIVLLSPIAAAAQFGYTTNGNGVTITNYSGPGGAVTIPSTIEGLPVIGIGGGLRRQCRSHQHRDPEQRQQH